MQSSAMQGFCLIFEGKTGRLQPPQCESVLHRAGNMPRRTTRCVETISLREQSVHHRHYARSAVQDTRCSDAKNPADSGNQLLRSATWLSAIETTVASVTALAALLLAPDITPYPFTYAYATETMTLTSAQEKISVPTASILKQLTSASQDSSPKESDSLSPYLRSRANPQVPGLVKGWVA